MARCEVCHEGTDMPYVCNRCGNPYCSAHRLPEKHDCVGLEDWNDPDGVFDDGGDSGSWRGGAGDTGRDGGLSVPIDTGPGGPLSYVRGNLTYLFLALMWGTFALQILMDLIGVPASIQQALFVISTEHPEYVWTWVTSIFAHGGFGHIVTNSIVIFFFGRLVERRVGTRNYALLFIGSGILAGLGQIGITLLTNPGVTAGALGASGAGLAIMGVLTVLNPQLKVYLYFLLPVPIWLLTTGYALFTVAALQAGPGIGGVAHVAHLVGLLIGLAYGYRVRRRGADIPRRLQFGGGPGGPGGPGRGRGPF